MQLTNIKELEAFKDAVAKCSGEVWLLSPCGDKYNLKSAFSQYIAFGALLGEHGNELELFCQLFTDEQYFLKFFHENPNTL